VLPDVLPELSPELSPELPPPTIILSLDESLEVEEI
jgi:hypothetical protein